MRKVLRTAHRIQNGNWKTIGRANFFRNFFAGLGYRTEVCRSAFAASQIVNEHFNLRISVIRDKSKLAIKKKLKMEASFDFGVVSLYALNA